MCLQARRAAPGPECRGRRVARAPPSAPTRQPCRRGARGSWHRRARRRRRLRARIGATLRWRREAPPVLYASAVHSTQLRVTWLSEPIAIGNARPSQRAGRSARRRGWPRWADDDTGAGIAATDSISCGSACVACTAAASARRGRPGAPASQDWSRAGRLQAIGDLADLLGDVDVQRRRGRLASQPVAAAWIEAGAAAPALDRRPRRRGLARGTDPAARRATAAASAAKQRWSSRSARIRQSSALVEHRQQQRQAEAGVGRCVGKRPRQLERIVVRAAVGTVLQVVKLADLGVAAAQRST